MKWCLLLCLLIITIGNSTGQRIRFTDSSNQWKVLFYGGDPAFPQSFVQEFSYGADTVISGKLYKRLSYYATTNSYTGFREDTSSGHIYIRHITNAGTDTLEHLFFDYNLAVSDTLLIDYDPAYNYKHYVASIEAITLNGQSYKVWNMHEVYTGYYAVVSYSFIEGIGSIQGPAFSIAPVNFESGSQLRCFSNQGITSPCNPALPLPFANAPVRTGPALAPFFDNTSSCIFKVGIELIENQKIGPAVVPDPANKSSRIILPFNMREGTLSIYNSSGQQMIREIVKNTSIIAMPDIISKQGLYFYQVTDGVHSRGFKGKFLFE